MKPDLDTPLLPLSKTERANYVDDVRGIIIGDHLKTARLYSKHTRRQVAQSNEIESDNAAREWAKNWLASQKKEQGFEFSRIYGSVGFELRIWD